MNIVFKAPNYSVGPHIEVVDLQALKAWGFTDLVCNRPDSELVDEPNSMDLSAAAENLGMRFHYLPVEPGGPLAAQSEALGNLLDIPDRKVFAFCRSGARSSAVWENA